MYHCYKFAADEIYFLADTCLYSSRILSIGFCPRCKKPVAELVEKRFDGKYFKQTLSGIDANTMMLSHADEILYSWGSMNHKKIKIRPFGWVYGINKELKNKKIKQYACDFYGNKELIKTI